MVKVATVKFTSISPGGLSLRMTSKHLEIGGLGGAIYLHVPLMVLRHTGLATRTGMPTFRD